MDFNAFKEMYSIQLNEQQNAAVTATQGAVLLLAVPGSGKTTVLVTRLGYMIFAKGISPENILTMTYTVAATKDMKARFASLFGEDVAGKLNFSTINSVSYQIIRCFERMLGRTAFELIGSEQDTGKLIGDIYRKVTGEFAQEGDIKNIRSLITYVKNMMLGDDEINGLEEECKQFSAIYREYCNTLLKLKKMDFDDQMVYAYKILRSHPEILSYFRNRYKYICVDEAQDTSKIQHMIIRMLAGENGNIFMVGDEDQSIYGFRAAYPEALMNFEKTYPSAKILMLETNYRSTSQIVSNADSFIKMNKVRRQKNMKASQGKGKPIKSLAVNSRTEQYAIIAQLAENCNEQTAVLYRDNDSAIPLIDIFERKGISYQCRGNDTGFFTHAVVRDVTDIINFAFDTSNDELFMRIYYKFSKGISKADAVNAVKVSREHSVNLLDALAKYCDLQKWCRDNVNELKWNFDIIKESPAAVGMNRIINFMGYTDYLDSRGADKSKLDILRAVAENAGSAKEFLLRLRELEAIIRNGSRTRSNFILSTIHSAKGLEYDNVIIIDVIDGLFPKIEGNFMSEADNLQLEEERRLFYVGITRAKKELTLVQYNTPVYCSMFTSYFFPKKKERSILPKKKYSASIIRKEADISAFAEGVRVKHKAFGEGTICGVKNGIAEILFSGREPRYIDIAVAVKNGKISLK